MISRVAGRMRRRVWAMAARGALATVTLLLAAVFLAVAMPDQARAENYRYTLSGTMLGAPVSGSFDYDTTTATYSNVNITYTASFSASVTGGFNRQNPTFASGTPGALVAVTKSGSLTNSPVFVIEFTVGPGGVMNPTLYQAGLCANAGCSLITTPYQNQTTNMTSMTITPSPAPPTLTAPTAGATLQTTAPTFAGAGNAGATIDIQLDAGDGNGFLSWFTATVAGNGTWSHTVLSSLTAGTYQVRVRQSSDGGSTWSGFSASRSFTLASNAPLLSGAIGIYVHTSGGVSQLTGQNLSGAALTFDGTPATITTNTPSLIEFTTPVLSTGYKTASVTTANGTASFEGAVFVVNGLSNTASFSPASVPQGGTSRLTFTVARPAGDTLFRRNISFTAALPAGLEVAATPNASASCAGGVWSPSAGATSLTLGVGSGNSAALPGATPNCTFAVDVTVTTAGNKTVTPSDASVNFGLHRSPGEPGVGATLTVTAPLAVPTVTALSTAIGPAAGGKTVVITGTNLDGATAVAFGGTAATSFTIDSPTQITAVSPARAAGLVNVTVTAPGGTSDSAGTADDFTYYVPRTARLIAPGTINEGDSGTTNSVWFISLDGSSTVPISLTIRSVPGTAASGVDFTPVNVSGTIPAGGAGTSVPVAIIGDLLDEDNETFSLEIVSISEAGLIHPTAGIVSGTIIDDDATPTLSIDDVAVTEGDAGTTSMTFTVALGAVSGRTVTVDYAAADGTATAPDDYAAVSGTLTFAPGTASLPVVVTLNGDTTAEPDETLFVNLSGAVNATLADGQGTGTITNDDVAAPVVTSVSPASGPAGGGTVVTITGTDLTGATAVSFGGTPATAFVVNGPTEITATAPAGTGAVDVTVATPGGTSAVVPAGRFTYNSALGVSLSFAPDPLVVGGGNGTLTLTFTNPNAGGSGTFNFSLMTDAVHTARVPGLGGTCGIGAGNTSIPSTSQVNFTNISIPAGTCTVTLPYRGVSAGSAAFTTTAFTPAGYPQTTGASATITVLPAAPTVTALAPASGPLAGGTSVTLTGTDFTGATAVTFGATAATSFTIDSATRITAVAPAGAAGTVDVRVTTPSGTSSTAGTGNNYVYVAAPSAPVTLTPANGAVTADTTPTYTGTAGAGLSVDVIVDGATIGTTTASGGGAWSFTPSAPLTDGTHTVRATATNAGGTSPTSNVNTFTVDTTAPTAPVVSTPANGATINTATPAYAGTAEAGSTVTVIVDGATVGSTAVDGAGDWVFTQPTPLSPGPHTVRATAADPAGNTSAASSTNSFTYAPVTLPGGALAGGQVGTPYTAAITASGGVAPYAYSLVGGALPPGVSLSSGGALTGTPTVSGAYGFTVTATDDDGLQATAAYTLAVAAPPTPDADPETSTVSSTGGPQGIDLSGAVAGAAGIQIVSPPTHGTATVSGFTVTYTPQPGYFGVVTFTYKAIGHADGSSPPPESAPATVTITIPDPVLALPGGALPGATAATPYSQAFAADGGTAPYSYAITGGALPAGLTLSGAGVLSGTPTAGGNFSFSVTATDSSTGTGPFSVTGAYTLTVAAPAIALTPASLPNAAVAVTGYSQAITASGGVAPYSYAVTGGALPAGMSLSSAGVLSGTPTAGGDFTFTVTATDSSTGTGPFTGSLDYSLTVEAATVVVTPNTLPSARRGFAYSQTFSATGGVGSYSWDLASGSLPAGLTLSSTGVLSGTPTATGSFPVQIRATDQSTGSGPYAGTVSVTLVVDAATITVTPNTLPGVMAGVAYDQPLAASGGAGSYSWAVTAGALPAGITLSSTGRISGASYAVGTASFTVTATDSFGNTGSAALQLAVLARPDPSLDPDVRGLTTAEAEATRRLTSTQIDNFSRRLEQLHNGGEVDSMTMGLSLTSGVAPLAQDADQRTRLGGGRMFASLRPELDRADLDAMLWRDAVRAGTGSGVAAGGLAAGQGAGAGDDGPSSGVRVWTGGAIIIGERDGDTGQSRFTLRSSGLSMGADIAVGPNLDLGIGGGFGEESADVGAADSGVDTASYVGVVYGSWRPAEGVFLDAILGWGQLEFDLRRRVTIDNSLVTGERDGSVRFGSVALGVDRPLAGGRFGAYGRLESMAADLDAYTEVGSPLWALSYDARELDSLQGVMGLRFSRAHEVRDAVWTPSFRFEYRREFGDGGVQDIQYADWLTGPTYQFQDAGWERSEYSLGVGVTLSTADGWTLGSELGARLDSRQTAGTLRFTLLKRF